MINGFKNEIGEWQNCKLCLANYIDLQYFIDKRSRTCSFRYESKAGFEASIMFMIIPNDRLKSLKVPRFNEKPVCRKNFSVAIRTDFYMD